MLIDNLHKIRESYRKNSEDIISLVTGSYPSFVYRNQNHIKEEEIPVFVFHNIDEIYFEQQIKYLAENNYVTLCSDDIYKVLIKEKKWHSKQIVLTFDDGLRDLYTIAFPILKKYGLSAISFLIPGLIMDRGNLPLNLEDDWLSKSDLITIKKFNKSYTFCSWQEIIEMHKSGIIDFQSHSLMHQTVYTSDKLIDFVNPGFKPNFLRNSYQPELFYDDINYGTPIFKSEPNLSASSRFIVNHNITQTCVNYVQDNGGEMFFINPNWRSKLEKVIKEFKQKDSLGSYQSKQERLNEIFTDLKSSKEIIEKKLNKSVNHICFPWFSYKDFTLDLAKNAGYIAAYGGVKSRRDIIKPVENNFLIKRIANNYILSLPGESRRSIYKVLSEKLVRK